MERVVSAIDGRITVGLTVGMAGMFPQYRVRCYFFVSKEHYRKQSLRKVLR